MAEKRFFWCTEAKNDLDRFPDEIGHEVCRVVTALQRGDRHLQLVPVKGAPQKLRVELMSFFDGKTSRGVFFSSDGNAVRVLHTYEKKGARKSAPSKGAVATASERAQATTRLPLFQRSDGNAFADMGIEFPDEFKGEAIIANEIYRIIKKRKMSKAAAKKAMDCKPEFIDAILNGRFTGFALRWPAVYLSRLGFDFEINFKPTPGQRVGKIIVHTA